MPDLGNSLADYDFYRNDRVQAALAEQGKKPTPSLIEGMKAAYRTEMTIKSLIDSQAFAPDPNDTLSKDEWSALIKDIPEEFHHQFVKGHSKDHREQIRADILQELQDKETLDRMGWTGTGLRMGAAITDPVQLVVTSLTGGLGALGKAGRAARFIEGGMVAGVSNAAVEAYLNRKQYTRDAGDIAVAGLMGFGLGGLAGVFTKAEDRALRAAAHRGADEIDLTRVATTGPSMGVSLTPEGEKALGYAGGKLGKADVQIRVNSLMNDVFGAEIEKAPVGLRLIVADMVKDGGTESLYQAKKLLKEQASAMARETADARSALADRMRQLMALKKETEIDSAFTQLKQAGAVKSADELIAQAMGKEAGGTLNQMQRAMLESLVRNGDEEAARKMAAGFARDVLHDIHGKATAAAKAADEAKGFKAMDSFKERDLAKGKADAEATMRELDGKQGSLPKDPPKPEPVKETPKNADEPKADTGADPAPRDHVPGSTVHALDKEGEEFTAVIKKVSADGRKIVLEDIRTGKVHSVPAENVTNVIDTPVEQRLKQTAEPLTKEEISEIGGSSIGAAQVRDSTIDSTDLIDFKIPGTNIRIPLRFDLYAIIDRSEIPMLKQLGRMLFADGVGGVERGRTAAELAEMDFKMFKGRWEETHNAAYEKWLLDNPTPLMKRQEAWLRFNEQVTAYKRGVPGEYHQAIKESAAKADQLMSELLDLAKKHGVQGAEDVEAMRNYVTRRFDHDNIAVVLNDLTERLGTRDAAIGAVEKLIARAIMSVREIEPEKAMVVAKEYFKTVRRLRFDPVMNRAACGEREYARLREALGEIGIDKGAIEDVLSMVTGKSKEVSDSGNMPRFKARTTLDETFEMDIGGYKLKVSDLFDNNMDNLMNLYTKQMTGAIGMAKVGIKSHADFDAMLKQAREYAADYQGVINTDKALKHIKYVEDGYKQIMGIPVDATMGTGFTRSMRVLRDFNFFLRMGQAGMAQIAEIGNIMGQVGMRVFSQHVPSLGEFFDMAKGGRIDDQLGKDILNLWGIGAEMLNHPHMKELDNLTHSKTLARLENAAESAKWLTARVSGLSSMNNILHQMSYRMIIQKMLNQAVGGVEKLSASQLKRLATAGLDSHLENVFDNLKKFAKADEFGKVTQIDYEGWAKASPDNFELFRLAVFREARRAVQEHAVGETHPWMHTMLGQIIFQFRSFMLVAHSKQFLHNVAHMDSQTLAMWGFSSLFAGMAYTVQTAANYAGDAEGLDKNLTPEKVGKAAFSRAGFSALSPMAIDTVTHFTSYEPFFSGTRSSGLESAVTNPTFDLGRKYQNTLSNLGRSVFDSEYMATRQDIKDGLGGFLPNYFGVRNFINAVANEYPKKNPLKQPMDE